MTEREKILLRREGARIVLSCQGFGVDVDRIDRIVNWTFPLPKKVEPRELIIRGLTYRCVRDKMQWRARDTDVWRYDVQPVNYYNHIELQTLADLKLSPNKEVEDE